MKGDKNLRIGPRVVAGTVRSLAFWYCFAAVSPFASAATLPAPAATPPEALRCPHTPRSDISSAIRSLGSNDKSARLTAAGALAQIGEDALPALMAEIPKNILHNTESDAWPETQRDFAIVLTDVIRAIVSGNRAGILRFRKCTTDTIVKPLTWAARGDNKRLRVNAANILAETIDNTTVCFVLRHLRDDSISPAGRANLLGVTNAMASYAYKDNVNSIKETIDIVNQQIGSSPEFDQSRAIIKDISDRISKSKNKDVSLRDADLAVYCGGYNFSAKLD